MLENRNLLIAPAALMAWCSTCRYPKSTLVLGEVDNNIVCKLRPLPFERGGSAFSDC